MFFDVVKHTVVVVRHHGNLHHHHFFAASEVGHELFVDLQIGVLKARVCVFFRHLLRTFRRSLGGFGFFVKFIDFFMCSGFALMLEIAREIEGCENHYDQ